MRANLIGVRQKIGRADHHFRELKSSLDQWGTSENSNYSFIINDDPKGKRVVFRHGKIRANDPLWPLLVGDIVHNLRAALDHLVCQLAVLNGNDISCCNRTYFPICICKPDFTKFKKTVEPLLSAEAFAAIEELQPYYAANIAGKEPTANTLWIISKLDILDKHRLLVVVGKHFRTTDLTYALNDAEPVNVPVNDFWRPLEDGTEIASIDVSGVSLSEKDKMHMQGGTQVQVFIRETGTGCDGVEAIAAMLPCIRYVSEIVDFFEREFFAE